MKYRPRCPMLRAAQDYAAAGHRVFPVRVYRDKKGSWVKVPALRCPRKGGPVNRFPAAWQDPSKGAIHQASRNVDEVTGMWLAHPGCAIGYGAPPRVVIVDVDGAAMLARLRASRPDLALLLEQADTFRVRTPGHRGLHVYYGLLAGMVVGQTAAAGLTRAGEDDVRRMVDVRVGGRGLTVLPPSRTAAGAYEVDHGTLDELEVLPVEWAAALAGRPRPVAASKPAPVRRSVSLKPSTYTPGGSILESDPGPPGGGKWPAGTGRHPILFPRACAMRELGWPIERALAETHETNLRIFEDPKDAGLVEPMSAGRLLPIRRRSMKKGLQYDEEDTQTRADAYLVGGTWQRDEPGAWTWYGSPFADMLYRLYGIRVHDHRRDWNRHEDGLLIEDVWDRLTGRPHDVDWNRGGGRMWAELLALLTNGDRHPLLIITHSHGAQVAAIALQAMERRGELKKPVREVCWLAVDPPVRRDMADAYRHSGLFLSRTSKRPIVQTRSSGANWRSWPRWAGARRWPWDGSKLTPDTVLLPQPGGHSRVLERPDSYPGFWQAVFDHFDFPLAGLKRGVIRD